MIIYKITNKINGKAYVGQTNGSLQTRWQHHIRHNKFLLGKAIKKYGTESFIAEELAKVDTREELNNLETKFILEHNTLSPNGYNLNTGGDAMTPSEETRKLKSEQTKGVKNPFYGKTHSPEVREKIRKIATGRKVSEEHKEKIREANRRRPKKIGKDSVLWGRKHTEETKKKMSLKAAGENNPFHGKKHSKDFNKHWAEQMKNNPSWASWTRRAVEGINIATGEKIQLTHMSADPRFDRSCIARCATGKQKTHQGYTWKFI